MKVDTQAHTDLLKPAPFLLFTMLTVGGVPDVVGCSACYGKVDEQTVRSVNWAVYSMLGILVPVLVAFGLFIRHLYLRSRFVEQTGVALIPDHPD